VEVGQLRRSGPRKPLSKAHHNVSGTAFAYVWAGFRGKVNTVVFIRCQSSISCHPVTRSTLLRKRNSSIYATQIFLPPRRTLFLHLPLHEEDCQDRPYYRPGIRQSSSNTEPYIPFQYHIISAVATTAIPKKPKPHIQLSNKIRRLNNGLDSYLLITACRYSNPAQPSMRPASSMIAISAGRRGDPLGVEDVLKGSFHRSRVRIAVPTKRKPR